MSDIDTIHNKVVDAWVAEEIRTLDFGYKSVHLKLDREVQISIASGGMVFNFTPRKKSARINCRTGHNAHIIFHVRKKIPVVNA